MAQTLTPHHTPQLTKWSLLIPEREWEVYHRVIEEAEARELPFAVGGAFAMATYTGYWRNTKDLDLYVLPRHRERMIEMLGALGLKDYYDVKPYDRWWIYRAHNDETIVDAIWAMANHRQEIDELWMSGPEVNMRGCRVKALPAEAMVWDKLYIMQRDRCDWPDVFNLLYATGAELDWQYLICRIGDDLPLLAGALSVYRWMSPGRAGQLPDWIWERAGLPPAPGVPLAEIDCRRVSLLDTRPWYGPDREKLQPPEGG
ncbi:MAG TPA: hypothetical protein VGF59_20345 [Bryobacteraceae bacterium]|jgi:hypothetical protein